MTPEEVGRYWSTLQAIGIGGILAAIVVVLYKGWVVTAAECDRRVAASEEKVELLRAELERREGLYIASLAELRASVKDGAAARERIQASLDKNIEQLYRFSDVLGDLRDAIRNPIPRGGP